MRKLPVFRSVGEVFSGVTRHYFQLIGAAWPALIFVVAALGLYIWSFRQAGMGELFEMIEAGASAEELAAAYQAVAVRATGPLYYVAFLLMTAASAVAAVRWHRFVLMGEGSGLPVRVEDARYIWTLIKVALLYILMIVILFAGIFGLMAMTRSAGDAGGGLAGALVTLGGAVAYLFILGIFMRLMLALPDAAIGLSGNVRAIFSATSGNTWRLIGYVALIGLLYSLMGLVLLVVFGVVGGVLGGGTLTVALLAVVGIAIYFYFLMLSITMLSVAYREIVGLPGAQGNTGIAPEPAPGL